MDARLKDARAIAEVARGKLEALGHQGFARWLAHAVADNTTHGGPWVKGECVEMATVAYEVLVGAENVLLSQPA